MTDPFSDWQAVVIPYITNKRLVEYGLGDGTAFLLAHATCVKSVEIAPDPTWWELVSKEHADNPNWSGQYYRVSEWSDTLAAYIASTALGYDVAFVDHYLHCRPETVNILFGTVPTIIAHDTSVGMNAYHWDRLKCPVDYVETVFLDGLGTTVWVRKG